MADTTLYCNNCGRSVEKPAEGNKCLHCGHSLEGEREAIQRNPSNPSQALLRRRSNERLSLE